MNIAINGAGVAGPALAHWLHRIGHEPTSGCAIRGPDS
jgi:2-polyprenyl-6-methoxyphenol hydroxylase-like FAD-dependent oxidoreductase